MQGKGRSYQYHFIPQEVNGLWLCSVSSNSCVLQQLSLPHGLVCFIVKWHADILVKNVIVT